MEVVLWLQKTLIVLSVEFWIFITTFGSLWFVVIALSIIALMNEMKLLKTYVLFFTIALSLSSAMKVIFNQPRPFEVSSEVASHLTALGKSFPSAHSVTAVFTFIMLGCLVFGRTKKKCPRILFTTLFSILAVLVMVSRIVLGQHFLQDVIVGGVIGAVCAVLGICFGKKQFGGENERSSVD